VGIDIECLGPAAQKQVREELERRRRAAAAKDRQQKARDGPALRPGGSDRGSALEEEYYRAYIWPKELAGTVANVERHKKFELLPKSDYCGLRLPAAHYTPDFVIEYTNGTVESTKQSAPCRGPMCTAAAFLSRNTPGQMAGYSQST